MAPVPAVEVRPSQWRLGDGPSPAPREGDSLGRPGLKIPRPVQLALLACLPHHQQTCMRPIERPAWCDGHFQGPVREIDAPWMELQACVMDVREAR
jgi:hypothetical protein